MDPQSVGSPFCKAIRYPNLGNNSSNTNKSRGRALVIITGNCTDAAQYSWLLICFGREDEEPYFSEPKEGAVEVFEVWLFRRGQHQLFQHSPDSDRSW